VLTLLQGLGRDVRKKVLDDIILIQYVWITNHMYMYLFKLTIREKLLYYYHGANHKIIQNSLIYAYKTSQDKENLKANHTWNTCINLNS
jgi:hypothetical protein